MMIGEVVDYIVSYNERQKKAEKRAEKEAKRERTNGSKRKATQADINSFFG